MAKELSKAQVNHLRRLLGWVRCEIPPEPQEVVKIVHRISPVIDSDDAKQKMVEWHREAESVPKYIRAALKSLEPLVREAEGEIIDPVPQVLAMATSEASGQNVEADRARGVGALPLLSATNDQQAVPALRRLGKS